MVSWPAGALLEYRDARGAVSERALTVRAIYPHDGCIMVQGICQLRNAMRAFRSDRILRLADPATGEVFTDIEVTLRASPLFDAGAEHVKKRKIKLPERLQMMAESLAFLGNLTPGCGPQKQSILVTFVTSAKRFADADLSALGDYLSMLDPPPEAADISALDFDDDIATAFARPAASLVGLDGVVTNDERQYVEDLLAWCDDIGFEADLAPLRATIA